MTPVATRARAGDTVCLEAVDLARSAVLEDAGADTVGAHLEAVTEDERVVTHYFAATMPGYQGWRWAVTVARASRAKTATVDEVALLPGDDALLPPAWVPWQERLRPGDLGVGDILPTTADDDRLVPAYSSDLDLDDDDAADVVIMLGLGRERVLSRIGRDDAVDRWHSGEPGPESAMAKAAPAPCASCGFWLPLAGALHGVFGGCANEYAPDDGRIVAADHGCGAHSQAMVLPGAADTTAVRTVDVDEFEVVDTTVVTEPVGLDEAPPEELGHS